MIQRWFILLSKNESNVRLQGIMHIPILTDIKFKQPKKSNLSFNFVSQIDLTKVRLKSLLETGLQISTNTVRLSPVGGSVHGNVCCDVFVPLFPRRFVPHQHYTMKTYFFEFLKKRKCLFFLSLRLIKPSVKNGCYCTMKHSSKKIHEWDDQFKANLMSYSAAPYKALKNDFSPRQNLSWEDRALMWEMTESNNYVSNRTIDLGTTHGEKPFRWYSGSLMRTNFTLLNRQKVFTPWNWFINHLSFGGSNFPSTSFHSSCQMQSPKCRFKAFFCWISVSEDLLATAAGGEGAFQGKPHSRPF